MLSLILLFILLSPGVLITLPPGSNGIFFSGQTSLDAAITATILFAAIIAFKERIPILRNIDSIY